MKMAAIILLILGVGAVYVYFKQGEFSGYKTLYIANNEIRVKVAADPEARKRGLQGVVALSPDEGMLFIFNELSEQKFWNNGTFLDLDVIWVKDALVAGIDFLPRESSEGIITIDSPEAVKFVIELPGGWAHSHQIKIGDNVVGLENK